MLKAKSEEIRETRIKRGYSLRVLGDIAGLNYATISNLENGKCSPYPATAKAVCEALKMNFDDLFEFREAQ